MKPIKIILASVCLSAATSLLASNHTMQNHTNMNHENMSHANMNHTNMKHEKSSASNHSGYHNEMTTRDNYRVILHSNKPFVNGNNDLEIMISHMNKEINKADVKIKFFMPEMPGMPYMEYETTAKFSDGNYKCKVNLSMNGTWQYQLKFRTEDKKIRSVKGSVNY